MEREYLEDLGISGPITGWLSGMELARVLSCRA
jgi:hypothetical protein